jgi:hypothetical protein
MDGDPKSQWVVVSLRLAAQRYTGGTTIRLRT